MEDGTVSNVHVMLRWRLGWTVPLSEKYEMKYNKIILRNNTFC
jgi:hypothetical protein